MENLKNIIANTYGGKIRVRACGVLFKDDAILLIKHRGIGENGFLWIPPGGGVEFGETIEQAIKREFKEECAMEIIVNQLLYIHQHIDLPLHAIELFYKVSLISGTPMLGKDPESKQAILEDITFINPHTIVDSDKKMFHPVVHFLQTQHSSY